MDDALVNVLDEEKEGEIRNVDAVSQGWLVSEDKEEKSKKKTIRLMTCMKGGG